MIFKLDNREYEVIIHKKNNKNTYIRVKDDLKIYVTTSYFATKSYKVISKKENKDNILYNFLGKSYEKIECNIFEKVEFDNDKIYIPNQKEFEKYIKKYTFKLFNERLEYNYNLFEEKIPYPKLKIRNMKTRWGVCNIRDNSVTLNSKLIEYDIEALNYVIVHELSHFIHFNHSKAFWNLVEKYKPDYKLIRKYLRD